jgi:hypothetical protein
MEKVFIKVNGLWVTNSWGSLGKVMLSANEKDREAIERSEVKFLREHFENVKAYEVQMVEVEV